MAGKQTTEKALDLLRYLPRVSLANLRPNPNSRMQVSFHMFYLQKNMIIQ